MHYRILRDLLKWVLYPFHTAIRSGPLAGKRWILSSGSKFIAGTYEPEKTSAICRITNLGETVYDVGAHVGYYSALMASLAGATGRVYAFEPRPINYAFLKRHLRLNHFQNVETYRLAIGRAQGGPEPQSARLETRTGTGTGRLSADGNLRVAVTSIDEFIAANRLPPPTLLKIDVEGGELDVLHGACQTIENHQPKIIIATHSYPLDDDCRSFLLERGYSAFILEQQQGDRETVYTPSRGAQQPPEFGLTAQPN